MVMLCECGAQAEWLIPYVDKHVGWQVKLCDYVNSAILKATKMRIAL